jgi:hypothetical protein
MEIMAKILIKLRSTQVHKELRKKGINTWVQFYPLTPEEAKIHRPTSYFCMNILRLKNKKI